MEVEVEVEDTVEWRWRWGGDLARSGQVALSTKALLTMALLTMALYSPRHYFPQHDSPALYLLWRSCSMVETRRVRDPRRLRRWRAAGCAAGGSRWGGGSRDPAGSSCGSRGE